MKHVTRTNVLLFVFTICLTAIIFKGFYNNTEGTLASKNEVEQDREFIQDLPTKLIVDEGAPPRIGIELIATPAIPFHAVGIVRESVTCDTVAQQRAGTFFEISCLGSGNTIYSVKADQSVEIIGNDKGGSIVSQANGIFSFKAKSTQLGAHTLSISSSHNNATTEVQFTINN